MKKAALHNLGCKVNLYETESMRGMLISAGYEIVPFEEKADVYVINTCTVTSIADKKSRQMIHRAKRNNPEAIIVAAGCYVQVSDKEIMEKAGADILIGNNTKSHLIARINEFERGKASHLSDIEDIGDIKEYEELEYSGSAEKSRAFIKIEEGCDNFCSYCRIPYARGRVRSRSIKEVLKEAYLAGTYGKREIVLTGINLPSFGRDTGEALIELVEALEKTEGIERVRLSSLEPVVVTEEFASRLSDCEKFCPHFHLSMQSGCDATLKRMNRHYDTAGYEKAVDIIRGRFTHPAITTDVIVGFPGETDEEFENTRRFIERIRFYEMHVFKFSRRKGTKAYDMPGQVDEKVKNLRSSILIDISGNNRSEFMEYYIGREVSVFPEEAVSENGKSFYEGYTKEYVKAVISNEAAKEGKSYTGMGLMIDEKGRLVVG